MDIDIVVLWVDGEDEKWLKEKRKYSPSINEDNRDRRYRSLDIFEYWFRGIEKYAPWVRKIHLVTEGHLPPWLNTSHPKLHIVRHSDFIPEKYLPTFSSHPIELNIHRIKDLSECFIYFNDDMFVINHVTLNDFFINLEPRDYALFSPITPSTNWYHILVNNIIALNRNFNFASTVKSHRSKWFSLRYGKLLLWNLLLTRRSGFSILRNGHLSIPFKKSTFMEVWDKEFNLLDQTCSNKFRNISDVSIWLMRYWRIAKGEIYPSKEIAGKYLNITSRNQIPEIRHAITSKLKVICLNDNISEDDYVVVENTLKKLLSNKFPLKSQFEL